MSRALAAREKPLCRYSDETQVAGRPAPVKPAKRLLLVLLFCRGLFCGLAAAETRRFRRHLLEHDLASMTR